MKNVMKRAWEIYRTLTGDHIAKLSMALRMAWAEAKAPETVGYVTLEGTPKQVSWATSIRENFFRNYLKWMIPEMITKFYGIVNRKTSAKFWIEEIWNKGVIDFDVAMSKCLAD